MWLLAALSTVVLAVSLHSILCRAPIEINIVSRFLLVGAGLAVPLTWWLIERYGIARPQGWAALLIYGLCCEFYIFMFTLAMSSISANLLVMLLGRSVSGAEIDRMYDNRRMVSARLDRLVAAGLLVETPTRIALSGKGTRTVRTFDWLRRFFGHDSVSS